MIKQKQLFIMKIKLERNAAILLANCKPYPGNWPAYFNSWGLKKEIALLLCSQKARKWLSPHLLYGDWELYMSHCLQLLGPKLFHTEQPTAVHPLLLQMKIIDLNYIRRLLRMMHQKQKS